MAMLEKKLLFIFYIFWIMVTAFILIYYGICLYFFVHSFFTFFVPLVGIYLLYCNIKISYFCFGILTFYTISQIMYSPWLINITHTILSYSVY